MARFWLHRRASRQDSRETFLSIGKNNMSEFKKYHCMECEHTYDEAEGDPDSGIAPGTRWEDIPDDWACPICGAPKSFFKLREY
jgi:rubredoxin